MIEEIVEQKLLLRYLIDNACSDSANLTDNELVTLLMRLQGCSKSEIAQVLEKEPDVPLKRRAVDWLQHQAVRKTLCASGLDETTALINQRKETVMPKGIYPRKPKEPQPAANGSHTVQDYAPTIEDLEDLAPTPRAKSNGNGDQPWGQPYEADPADIDAKPSKWDELYTDAMRRLEKTPPHKALVYPFQNDDDVDRAYEAVHRRVQKRRGIGVIRCGIRRNPPRLFILRGANWSK